MNERSEDNPTPSAIRLRQGFGGIWRRHLPRGGCHAVALAKADPLVQYVYVLQREGDPERFHVGATTDPVRRLHEHNSGKSIHTNKHKPWKLSVCIGFSDRAKALRFEQYLKSGSGRAFARKHF